MKSQLERHQFFRTTQKGQSTQKGTSMKNRISITMLTLAFAASFVAAARAERFSFTTGSPDGRLGALSRPAGAQGVETETADDFVLTQPTVVNGATIHGLVTGVVSPRFRRVEVEIYHIFPLDSDTGRTPNVPTRMNSPADHEISTATRDSNERNLIFFASGISDFRVQNTVINGINKFPLQLTHGEGAASGRQVELRIVFRAPLLLPAGHYFFRPEVALNEGNFLFLSAPRPVTSGTPFPTGTTDLQAWIRNANLTPDWLRIGADIIGAGTFNMTFSLRGNTVPGVGVAGQLNCDAQTVSAIEFQFGSLASAAPLLGYSSIDALRDGIRGFCQE
jgi:hypothetical protein